MAFDISNMTEEEKKEALKVLQADASKESTEKDLIPELEKIRFRKQLTKQ